MNVYLKYYIICICPGGDVWLGRQQIPECWVSSVDIRTFVWWMGQTGTLGNQAQCLFRQCALAYTSATPFVSCICYYLVPILSTACCSNYRSTVTSFILGLSTVCTTNMASYDRRSSFPSCSHKNMEQHTGGSDVSTIITYFWVNIEDTPFFCLIPVIFLLGLLYYTVKWLKCIAFFTLIVCMYVCVACIIVKWLLVASSKTE